MISKLPWVRTTSSLCPSSLVALLRHSLKNLLSTPIRSRLSFWWNTGSMLGTILVVQVFSGLLLIIFYIPSPSMALIRIEYITREVNLGWLARNLHSRGASLFFICLYAHIRRGLIVGRWRLWKVWSSGTILLLMVIGEALMGYVLPWGQISVWGACVITSLVRVIPLVGTQLVCWVWGGFVVRGATLKCFLMLHFLLPLAILGLTVAHLLALHESGRTRRLSRRDRERKVKFYPYLVIKDRVNLLWWGRLIRLVCLVPFFFSDYESFKEANLIRSPIHIQPEWYFLLLYAVLRSVPNKLGGVLLLVATLLILWGVCLFPIRAQSNWIRGHTFLLRLLFIVVVLLSFLGASPVEGPLILISQLLTLRLFLLLVRWFLFWCFLW